MMKWKKAERQTVYEKALCDPVRHYFIALSLKKVPSPYKEVLVSEDGACWVLFRKSGGVQLLVDTPVGYSHIARLLNRRQYTEVVCTEAAMTALMAQGLRARVRKGSSIAVLTRDALIEPEKRHATQPLDSTLLEAVEALYRKVFKGFPSSAYMREKLDTLRGRGEVILASGLPVSVAQSDFETQTQAVIVGVATDATALYKGYATSCTYALCHKLITAGKTVGLIYENEQAGRIYKRLGFVEVDHLYHLERMGV